MNARFVVREGAWAGRIRALHLEQVVFFLVLAALTLVYANKARVPVLLSVPPREAQTASQIRYYVDHGVDLLRSQYDLTPAPQHLLLEFPLYQALVATVYKVVGYDLAWGKEVSVLFLVGSLLYLHAIILRLCASRSTAILGTLLFAIAPYNARFQPILMTEPLVSFLSLLVLYHGIRLVDTDHPRDWALFACGGLAAILTKFPQSIVVLVPFLAWFLMQARAATGKQNLKTFARLLAIGTTWGLSLVAWAMWAARLNGRTVLNGFLMGDTSSFVSTYFGTWSARLDPAHYRSVLWFLGEFFGTSRNLAPVSGVILAGLVAMALKRDFRLLAFSLSWLFGFAAYFFTFFTVLSSHPYYWLPVIPALALPAAYLLDWLLGLCVQLAMRAGGSGAAPAPRLRQALPLALIALAGTALLAPAIDYLNRDLNAAMIFSPVITWSNYDYLNYLIIAAALAIFLGLFVSALIRKQLRTAALLVLICLLFSRFSSHAIDPRERWWALDTGYHWVVTKRTVDQTEYIKSRLPEDKLAVIVLHYPYSPHYLFMSGARGYTVGFPERTQLPCSSSRGFPLRLDAACIDRFLGEGIEDVFAVFYASDDMRFREFKKWAKGLHLSYVGQMQPSGPRAEGNVFHYRIRPAARRGREPATPMGS